nr:MAG TPA: hypothetical protein [Caudoviricetes sp.]
MFGVNLNVVDWNWLKHRKYLILRLVNLKIGHQMIMHYLMVSLILV